MRERDGHEWIVRTFGTVLKREWDAAKARVGDVVAIHYLGERQTKGGTTFHNWKVSAVQTAPAFVEQLADETATGERFATREEEAQIERAQRFAPAHRRTTRTRKRRESSPRRPCRCRTTTTGWRSTSRTNDGDRNEGGRLRPPPRPVALSGSPAARLHLPRGDAPEAAWLAAALFEAWPPRRRPQEVVLHRRPDVTDERWQALGQQARAGGDRPGRGPASRSRLRTARPSCAPGSPGRSRKARL